MPIDQLKFLFQPDIHLVRGQEMREDLRSSLWVEPGFNMLSIYQRDHNDVTVQFTPRFKAQTESAAESKGFGITVNRETGTVRVAGGAAPDPSPRNFILEASVTKNTGGVDPKTIPPAFMRVHVHHHVELVTLTPKRLTVRARPGSNGDEVNQQFTVRVQFDDGTVADVSDSRELTFSPNSIMEGRQIKIPASANPGDVLDVTVTTSALWGNKSDTAKIELLDEWSNEASAPEVELIDAQGGVWDGTTRPESALNVVIVACGFPAAAQDNFRDIARSLVHQIRGERLYQPYGYLSTSMNYWRLPIVSPEAGVNIRPEVRVFSQDGLLMATPVPMPAIPPATLNDWGLSHLIYAVGLPVAADLKLIALAGTPQIPADFDAVRAQAPEAFDYTKLFKRWKDIARAIPLVAFDQVAPALAHSWMTLGDRTFIDDVNAYPAVQIGSPPALGENPDLDSLEYDRRRKSDDIESLFRRVTAKANPADGSVIRLEGSPPENGVGNLWVIDPRDPATLKDWAFDNTRFVVTLCNSPIGRANAKVLTRLEQFIRNSPNNNIFQSVPVNRVAGRNGLSLALEMPSVAMLDHPTYEAFAHELGHKLGLGDEYSEVHGTYPESSEGSGNLTTEAASKDASGNISVDLIKWNWPRIRKTAVFTRPMAFRGNGVFHCTVPLERGLQFVAGNKVLLRKREPGNVIGPQSVMSPIEFEVKEVHRTNIDDAQDLFGMTLVIQADDPLISGPSMVVTFDTGSLIFLPVPAPSDLVPARPYLSLIPPAAERIMRSTGGAMTGNVCDVNASGVSVQAPVADPDGKLTPNLLPHVVGAYFGGSRYACGILRPTGMCIMRDHTIGPEQYKEGLKAPQGVSRFCVVCRYVMVEFVDPHQHWRLDKDYAEWFPF